MQLTAFELLITEFVFYYSTYLSTMCFHFQQLIRLTQPFLLPTTNTLLIQLWQEYNDLTKLYDQNIYH